MRKKIVIGAAVAAALVLPLAVHTASADNDRGDRGRRHFSSERISDEKDLVNPTRAPFRQAPQFKGGLGKLLKDIKQANPDVAKDDSTDAKAVAAAAAAAVPSAKTLVLYDTTGQWGWLGEAYGTMAANLTSHFGTYKAIPVNKYTNGMMAQYTATVYVGSTYDEPLSTAFLDDVAASTKPVIWMYDNIWQLTSRVADFQTKYGWAWKGFDATSTPTVTYKGQALNRSSLDMGGIMDYAAVDTTKATVLATANRADGTSFPYAIRSGNLTYMGENPFSYIAEADRSLVFQDILFDALAPATAVRHRALVRLEDVGPDADPAELRAATDYLYSQGVPFSVAVYSRYKDPKGVDNGGKATEYALKDRPQVVKELKYMQTRGGTLLMHGWTHQYKNVANPYNGVSADDFEFYSAHVDSTDKVIYDGPVADDSYLWASSRIMGATMDFMAAGISVPTIFEFPHYAGSATDYNVVQDLKAARYDRGLYFPGSLTGANKTSSTSWKTDNTKLIGQWFPYLVTDAYGSKVVPENIGNYEADAQNQHPAVLVPDLLARSKKNLVVRDGFASFFFHPYYDLNALKALVPGIKAQGYTFVSAPSVIANG